MSTLKSIDGGMTINEAIRVRPETVAVFHGLGLDACCGGSLPIQVASEKHGLDPAEVLGLLNATDDPVTPSDERGAPGV
jgi:iron-sulfur cluster repair protein YtfE (RIC family)